MNENALKLLEQRYFKNGEDWKGLVTRNVDAILGDSVKKEEIKQLILDRVFIPNSPSLVNAGYNNGLFACFTAGIEQDTLEDSFNDLKNIALVAKKGGGCGFTGSNLRAKDSPVAGSAHGYAYGPNRLAKLISFAMDAITQSGFRKMALMYTLSAEHPDIEEFIHLKQGDDERNCYNFNQSVFAKDDWMNRALTHEGSKEANLFDLICRHAWNNGEPALIFEDTVNRNTPYKYSDQYILTTNPCAEQPLPSYGSCNLASINLNHDYFHNKDGSFNFSKLANVSRLMVHYLDSTGSVNQFPTEEHRVWYENNRPIGIGIMGVGDLFLRHKLAYGKEKSLDFLDNILAVIYANAKDESELLGEWLGVPKANKSLPEPRRNSTLLSIAPTGSIAIIAECSHGIEPIFSPSFMRVDERGQEYLFVHPEANQPYFVSAVGERQATWKEQIDLVSVCQYWVDSGVSKTINLPNNATVQDVREAFIYAWKNNLKGITVYRDGSRNVQVLNQIKEGDSNECPTGVCVL